MMQNIIAAILITGGTLLFYGCASTPEIKTGKKVSLAKISLATAKKQEQAKQYLAALKQYSQLIEAAVNRTELYAAMRGKARCLRAMGRLKLALSALSPLSVNPETPLDCVQLGMAGELLLQLHKYKEAESTLEVALDGVRNKEKQYAPWTASASANLGNAYLRNGKLQQAQTMYKKAAKLFRASIKVLKEAHETEELERAQAGLERARI